MSLLRTLPRRRRGRRDLRLEMVEVLEQRQLLADGILPAAAPQINGTAGTALSNVLVATFTITDAALSGPGDSWKAQVSWGDGTTDRQVSVTTAGADGVWKFFDSHTYTTAGTYNVTVNMGVPLTHRGHDGNSVVTTAVISSSAATLQSIAVTPANPSIAKGLTQQFTATGTYSDNSTQNLTSQVTWVSGTPAVASITTAGLATGLGVGTSTITASLSGVSGSTLLTVTAPALQSIAVTPANPSIAKGLTQQFTATGTFSDNSTQNLTSQVTWSSGTPAVASIGTTTGLATALSPGTSTLGAALNGITGSTVLTVTAAALQSIAVTPANPSIAKGLTQQFTATGTFSDNSTQNITSQVTWSSGTPAVATIGAATGLATAVSPGTSSISASLSGVTGSTTLTVTAAALQSIAVTPANPSVAKGLTQQFTATGTYSDNSTQNLTSQVTWSSATPAVATIGTTTGLATALSPGTSSISATLSGITGSTTLSVTAAVLQSIAVTPANPSIAKGQTRQFAATGTYSDNSTQDLTTQVNWSSGTPGVATIGSSTGLATGVGTGTSTISATLSGVTGSTTLTVTAAQLVSIGVTPANPSVAKGLTEQFTATGTFTDNSTQNLTSQVTWTSATLTVATIVSTSGLATAVGTGTSTISASLSGVTGSTTLTVTAAALQSIAVTPANPSIAKGLTQQFTATGTYSDSSTQNLTTQVTWSSGTPAVATIGATTGLATAVSPGTSIISATLSGVTGSTTLTVTAAALQSISVTPANPSIAKGLTQQFTATGTFTDNSTQNLTTQVTWSSGTPAVATIGATTGLATAVATGTSTMSATLSGVTGSTTLTVTAAQLVSIAVTPANPTVAKGLTQQFTATGTFTDNSTQNLTTQVTWTSAAPAAATIGSTTGLATAVAAGTSNISAALGGISGATTLTVTAAALQSIAVTPANPSIAKGLTQQFTATGTYSDNSTQNLTSQVTWSSGTPAVATISATTGLATGVSSGSSSISATLSGITGSTTLTVTAAALQSIAVTPANPSVAKGLTQQFTATGTFTDNSTQNLTSQVTWSSGTPAVATIGATTGLATGVSLGSSTISATFSGVTGSTTLTVTAAALQSIAVTPANPSVAKGLTQQFTATGTYSDNSTQNITSQVTWASGTPAVATIGATTGLATAVGTGTSNISATLSGVTGSTTLTVTAAQLVSIAVTPANPTIAKGQTQQFTATGTFTDSSTQNLTSQVTWASATPAVATIGATTGLATGVTAGTSNISATLGGISGSTTLTVTAAALQSIAVTPVNPSIAKGLTQQFTATGTYSDNSTQNLTGQVTWVSATPGVATIGATGLATAVGTGTSNISASLGGISGSTTLTVTAAALQSIAVTPANPSVAKGLTQQFTATGTFTDNSTQNLTSQVTWSSGTPAVATIGATTGLATAVSPGTSSISATLSGITGSTTLTVTAAALQSIAVTPANPSVAKGLTQQFTATGTYSDNSTQNITTQVTWSSGTPAVATIGATTGVATALATGTSSISASLSGITGSTTLTVTAAVLQSIAVTPANPTIAKGATQQFVATGTYSDNSQQILTTQVTWSSGTPAVATIGSTTGLATGVAAGSSAISATLGGVTGSTTLTVTAAALVSIAVTPANPSVAKGLTEQFTATGTYSDNSTQNLTSQVTWASGTPSVATIVSTTGLATAVGTGSSSISATLSGVSGSTTLTVTAAALQSIAVTPANPTIAKGFTQQFTATGTYSDNSTQNLTSQVTWSSATPAVATIGATTGLATGVSSGSSSISATLSGITGSTTLTVTAAALRSIAITPANPSIAKGLTQQFTATGTYSDNSTQNLTTQVTWSSGTPAVASIGATSGLATALAAGTSTISASLSGITGSTTLTVTAAALQSIAITPANPTVAKGQTQQFTATGTYSDNTTQDLSSQVAWASATPGVATISAAGLATGLAAGTSNISATLGGISGSTTLTVTAAALQSIAVTPANPSLAKGLTQQFTATGTYSDNTTQNLTSQVTWLSGTPAVATISALGVATGVGTGTSTISASLSGISGSTTITVTAAALQSIAVTPANPSLAKGLTQQFTATGTFSDNSTQNLTSQVTWLSGTPAVATISTAGLATAVSPGTSTVSATLSGVTGSTTLTVTAAALQSIAVTPANPSVAKGQTQQFTATGSYSDNSTQNLTSQVTWASGTLGVATINAAGLATGVGAGSSAISATLGGVTGSTTLTVSAAQLVSIALTPANPSIAKGLSQQFTATGTFSDNSQQNLTSQVVWTSGTTGVATISTTGLATGVGVGTSTISAALGGISGSTTLTVSAAQLVSIGVTPSNTSVGQGATLQFTATGTYTDSSTQNLTSQVTWLSSASAVATISASGLATGIATGTTTISASLNGVSGSTQLSVGQPTLSPTVVKDNGLGGYTERGVWSTGAGGFNGTYRSTGPGLSSTVASWVLQVPAGTYTLYATWANSPANTTSASYQVFDSFTKLGVVVKNQQLAPADGQFGGVSWSNLGTFTITKGTVTIALSASLGGRTVADGMMLVPSGAGVSVANRVSIASSPVPSLASVLAPVPVVVSTNITPPQPATALPSGPPQFTKPTTIIEVPPAPEPRLMPQVQVHSVVTTKPSVLALFNQLRMKIMTRLGNHGLLHLMNFQRAGRRRS